MLIAALFTLVAVAGVVLIHYEALRLVSIAMPGMTIPPRSRLLVVIGVALVAHIVEIVLFAGVYFLLENGLGLGTLAGETEGGIWDHLYFSAATYSTLGVGDVTPTGPLRIVAGLESLAGLVLITWSASFTYLAMQEFWGRH
jgi:hypothetical protein